MQRINLSDYDDAASNIQTFSQELDKLTAMNLLQQPADNKNY